MQKAREVLEEQGFSLPVPRYNLRFDDGVLPFQALQPRLEVEAEADKKQPVPREHVSSVENIENIEGVEHVEDIEEMDVSPEQHLQEKVEDERQATQEEDLLDEDSPKE